MPVMDIEAFVFFDTLNTEFSNDNVSLHWDSRAAPLHHGLTSFWEEACKGKKKLDFFNIIRRNLQKRCSMTAWC